MPGQGEQHKPAAPSVNPFEEPTPHISEYTAQDIATLSSRLEKQLGPEYISSRPGAGGGKVHYLSADKCINLANEVFGFNGWSSGIQNIQIDFVDESQGTGKVSLGLSVIVRVTLRDGTFHEDVGYGHIENCKGKAAAFEKAKKEGTTDGLKRALRNFGNLLGNCVYDKEYVAKVTKLKVAPTRWHPDNLHRHPDFAPVKKESPPDSGEQQPTLPPLKRECPTDSEETHRKAVGDAEDEFGSDDFDEVDFSVPQGGHPDEITLDLAVSTEQSRRRNSLPSNKQSFMNGSNQKHTGGPRSPLASNNSTGPQIAPQTPLNGGVSNLGPPTKSNAPQHNQVPVMKPPDALIPAQRSNSASLAQQPPPPRIPQNAQPPFNRPQIDAPNDKFSDRSDHEPPVGFFTARAAESLQSGSNVPTKTSVFNPHLESPSIRKTAGVDHTKTKPIGRDAVGSSSSSGGAASPLLSRGPNSFVNPQTDKMRKLGLPGGGASPLQNRGSYKPPSIKRPALGDVPAKELNKVSNDGGDFKRQRLEGQAVTIGSEEMLDV